MAVIAPFLQQNADGIWHTYWTNIVSGATVSLIMTLRGPASSV